MKQNATLLSCSLLFLLFALLSLKVWMQHKRGLRNAPLTPVSLALVLVYVLLISTVAANAVAWQWPGFWLKPLIAGPWTVWFGGGLGCLGLLGGLMCMRSLGDAFRLGAVAQRPDKLVTTGVYAWSRNPFFCALFVWYVGMFFLLPCAGMGLVCLVFFLLVHMQTLQEEQILRHSCGAAYTDYCRNVSRYISLPRL